MTSSLSIACLTCAKAFQHAGGNAAGWAIFAMLVVLVVVLGTIAFLMVKFGLKSKASIDPKYADPFHDSPS